MYVDRLTIESNQYLVLIIRFISVTGAYDTGN